MNSSLATRATPLNLVPSAIERALDLSPLADLPPDLLAAIVEVGRIVDVTADDSLYRGAERNLGIVVSCRLRMLLTGEDGRRAVLRYARPGTLLGVSTVFGWPSAEDSIEWEAMVDSTVFLARADIVRAMAEEEPRLGCRLADDLGRVLAEIVGEFEVQAFGTVRRRVVHHLARMVSDAGSPSDRVEITQQDLAEAVGHGAGGRGAGPARAADGRRHRDRPVRHPGPARRPTPRGRRLTLPGPPG